MTTLTPERLANAARAVGLGPETRPDMWYWTHPDTGSRRWEMQATLGIESKWVCSGELVDCPATDDDADTFTFTRLRPAVKAAGCQIEESKVGADVFGGLEMQCLTGDSACTFSLALVLAIEWLQENQPEVLAKAVKEVRG